MVHGFVVVNIKKPLKKKEWDAEVLWDETETGYNDACYL
tara:strand:- start:940 stop:1056 length:117 start_codon:yes stop_codon:yes gene_type:complete